MASPPMADGDRFPTIYGCGKTFSISSYRSALYELFVNRTEDGSKSGMMEIEEIA